MVICPLCGFEFERGDALCAHGCPLSSLCDLTRCPSCDYEFPSARPKRPGLWRRLFRSRVGRDVVPAEHTVRDMQSGRVARVVALAGGDGRRSNQLAVFGVIPGAEVELLQRRPAFVLKVGETELALDPEIAAEIVVEPVPLPGDQAAADTAAPTAAD